MNRDGGSWLWAMIALVVLSGVTGTVRGAELSGQTRRALLVGISTYDRGTDDDWWDLASQNDVDAIASLLQRRFGFAPADILVLQEPAETTRDALIATFRTWLIEPTRPGDIIYFHYSGHGSEMPDQDGDELDGLDECLVPSDYVSRHDSSGNLRDDTLAGLLDELAAKQPGNVTLTFDCCYSGTATRAGRTVVRGQSLAEESASPGSTTLRRGSGETDAPADGASGIVPGTHPAAASYVVLSATSQGQLAGEVDGGQGLAMGRFTHAFVEAASRVRPGATYRDLFELIANRMLRTSRQQTPQLEGSSTGCCSPAISARCRPTHRSPSIPRSDSSWRRDRSRDRPRVPSWPSFPPGPSTSRRHRRWPGPSSSRPI
ncbi:MAG: caspase family protein [bacterium]